MRTMSIGMMKKSQPAGRTAGALPGFGTRTRTVYDVLYRYRGMYVPEDDWRVLHRAMTSKGSRLIQQVYKLRDYYGCDIRTKGSGTYGRMYRMMLAGEWSGRVYIDYVAERLADLEVDLPLS